MGHIFIGLYTLQSFGCHLMAFLSVFSGMFMGINSKSNLQMPPKKKQKRMPAATDRQGQEAQRVSIKVCRD